MKVEVENVSFRYEVDGGPIEKDRGHRHRGAAPGLRPYALHGMNLAVDSGELVALLGPSGSGKTTLLEILAGFLRPESGTVRFGDRTVSSPRIKTPPRERDVGMVFQDLALWEHLTVDAHLDFVLSSRGVGREERKRRKAEILRLVDLEDFAGRRPPSLSGGEAQRLALARALVAEPRVLLFDEPLGALDRSLRQKMLHFVSEVHASLHPTIIYVTHDYEEAVSLADRIAALDRGRALQQAGPEALYRYPAHPTVARLTGTASLLKGEVVAPRSVECALGRLPAAFDAPLETAVTVVLRPEEVELLEDPHGRAVVRTSQFRAGRWKIEVEIGDERIEGHAARALAPGVKVGARVREPVWGWGTTADGFALTAERD